MGSDKGLLPMDGLPAREHFRQMLLPCCDQAWVSLRPEQLPGSSSGERSFSVDLPIHTGATSLNARPGSSADPPTLFLPDLFPGEGPLGALYSAFRFRPDADWFILPCDLPNMTRGVLQDVATRWREKRLSPTRPSRSATHPDPSNSSVRDISATQNRSKTVSSAEHPAPALLLRHPDRLLPEPLSGIWSSEAGALVEQMFNMGERAVFRVLPKLSVLEMVPSDLLVLENRNA
jgi:molybdopterin-guanine dinucleotide biosynthesis protein A